MSDKVNIEEVELSKLYEAKRINLGLEHPETINMMFKLAYYHQHHHNNIKAFELYNKMYELRKKKFTENHIDTINSMFNLANIYIRLGKISKGNRIIQCIKHHMSFFII